MAFNFFNWKFNPFTQVFNPVNVIGEQHIVAFDDDANAYGIRLHQEIELVGSLPFNTNINYGIFEDVTGGAQLTETPRTNPPDAGFFRVDYSANTYFATSFIEFNAADDGLAVIVNYRGKGTVVKARYQLLSEVIFPANVGIQGNLTVTDSLYVGPGTIDPAAVGQFDSTTRGFLPPRMTTTQRDAITSPPVGLHIYNITTNTLDILGALGWESNQSSGEKLYGQMTLGGF